MTYRLRAGWIDALVGAGPNGALRSRYHASADLRAFMSRTRSAGSTSPTAHQDVRHAQHKTERAMLPASQR